jgi:hypothetical protein
MLDGQRCHAECPGAVAVGFVWCFWLDAGTISDTIGSSECVEDVAAAGSLWIAVQSVWFSIRLPCEGGNACTSDDVAGRALSALRAIEESLRAALATALNVDDQSIVGVTVAELHNSLYASFEVVPPLGTTTSMLIERVESLQRNGSSLQATFKERLASSGVRVTSITQAAAPRVIESKRMWTTTPLVPTASPTMPPAADVSPASVSEATTRLVALVAGASALTCCCIVAAGGAGLLLRKKARSRHLQAPLEFVDVGEEQLTAVAPTLTPAVLHRPPASTALGCPSREDWDEQLIRAAREIWLETCETQDDEGSEQPQLSLPEDDILSASTIVLEQRSEDSWGKERYGNAPQLRTRPEQIFRAAGYPPFVSPPRNVSPPRARSFTYGSPATLPSLLDPEEARRLK